MSKKASVIIFSALGAVILALGALLAYTVASNTNTIVGLGMINDDLEQQKSALVSHKENLEAQVAELQSKLENAGELYADEIDALKLEIENKLTAIAELEADIAKYQTVFTIDVRAQAQLIDELEEYIKNEIPCVKVKLQEKQVEEDTDADADAPEYKWVSVAELIKEEETKRSADPEAEPLYTDEELAVSGMSAEALSAVKLRELVFAREDVILPSISLYYEDLATGYHYGYNENAIYDCASVIKAPYVMSILRAVSADEKAYIDAKAATGEVPERIDTDEDGIPDTTVIEYSDPIYNLYDAVTYERKTMWAEGSGKIKDMEDGTEVTYLDFAKYTLEYSDNVGFTQLKKRFGYSSYYALTRELKANSTLAGGNSMSAADAGKLFKAIYEFIEDDELYGQIMYDSMLKSNHTVIIPYGVSPTKALHKYGWDNGAYHDAAIVLHADKPYVLAVFTDLEEGGNAVNAYLQNIVRMLNNLHKGFYQS